MSLLTLKTQKELVEIVKDLRNNVDEAEQFEPYINTLIENCSKKALILIAEQLALAVKDNMETYYLRESLNYSDEELKKVLKKVLGE